MRAGVELALAAGAFGQQVTVVVSGRACELLDKTVHMDESLYKLIWALPYYEIPRVHILSEETPCLLYTSPSPRDATLSRMPSSA